MQRFVSTSTWVIAVGALPLLQNRLGRIRTCEATLPIITFFHRACHCSFLHPSDVLVYHECSFVPTYQEFDLRVDIESLGVGPQGQEGVMPTELNYDAFRVLLS